MKVLTILLALTTTPALAQSARTDIVYLTYCPNIEGANCQHIYYQCTNPQNSTDVGDCIKQPDTEVVLPE
jgi:hypothetical protein